MEDIHSKEQKLVSTLILSLRQNNKSRLANIVKESEYNLQINKSSCFGDDCTIIFYYPINKYPYLIQEKDNIEKDLYENIRNFYRDDSINISSVIIQAKINMYLDWDAIHPDETKDSLLELVQEEKNTLIKAATAVISIRDEKENNSYKKKHDYLNKTLKKLGLDPIHKYNDLWDWYNDYNNRNLKTYESRRVYIRQLFAPLIEQIQNSEENQLELFQYEKTGWDKVDEEVSNMKIVLKEARSNRDFQSVGLRGRELLITLAQTVFIKEKHPSIDGVDISKTDSKRMLEAFVSYCLKNKRNWEKEAKYIRHVINFSNELTHERSATIVDAELCYSAVISTVQIIKILHRYNQ